MNYTILNQWRLPECASYALVACLMRMKNIDHDKLLAEMSPDFKRLFSHESVGLWLRKRGYIKDLVAYRYNPLLLPQIPIIARLFGVDWEKTRQAPYKLTMGVKSTFAHYVCITDKWVAVNSWGEAWGDKWYFYFDEEQKKEFGMASRILI